MDKKAQEKLVLEIKSNPQAFAKLYEEYFDRLLNFIFRRVLNVEESEDILSNTFLKVLKNINQFNPERGSLTTWMYSIAINEIRKSFRSKKYTCNLDQEYLSNLKDEDVEAVEEVLAKHDAFLVLSASIKKIKPVYQELIQLRFFEEMNNSEIAEILNMKEGTVRVKMHRALKSLDRHLEDDAKLLLKNYV